MRGQDYIYAQLEVSIRAAKDHGAMQGLHAMLGEFARVRSASYTTCLRLCSRR